MMALIILMGDIVFNGDLSISHSMIMMVNYHSPNILREFLCLSHCENIHTWQPEIQCSFKLLVTVCERLLSVRKNLQINNFITEILSCFTTEINSSFSGVFVSLGFMAYQALKVIWCQIHFYTNKQFYFKQFSLA